MNAIENEMGYDSPDGTGLNVDMLRRLAHFLILEACGELENFPEPVLPKAHAQEKVQTPARRKRLLVNEDNEISTYNLNDDIKEIDFEENTDIHVKICDFGVRSERL